MPKPSILQTLLREPTRSYSQTSSSSDYDSRPRSSRRGTASIHSTGSTSTTYSQQSHHTGVGAPLNYPAPNSSNGGRWEWSTFGGRRGLTGGEGSLRAPSIIFGGGSRGDNESIRSGRTSRSEGFGGGAADTRSLRSVGSFRSIASAAASLSEGYGPGRREKKSTPSTTYGSLVTPQQTLSSSGSSSKSIHGTSRRYSDAALTPAAANSPERLRRHSSNSLSSSAQSFSSAHSNLRYSVVSPAPSAVSPSVDRNGSVKHMVDGRPETREERKVRRAEKKRKRAEEEAAAAAAAAGAPALEAGVADSRAESQHVTEALGESRGYPRRDFRLERVDETMEEELEVRRRSLVLLNNDGFGLETLHPVGAGSGDEGREVEHGIKSGEAQEVLSDETVGVLERFEGKEVGLTKVPAPSAPSSPVVPEVGRVYTMDEIFSTVSPSSSASAGPSSTQLSPSEVPLPISAASSPRNSFEDRRASSPSSAAPGKPATSFTSALPAVQRVAVTSPSGSDVSSAPSSSLFSTTDVSSPATELSTVFSHKLPASTKSTPEVGSVASGQPPRIRLTRTESDQEAAGVEGDIELRHDGTSNPPERAAMSTDRRRRVPKEVVAPPPINSTGTIEVISSAKLTTANLARKSSTGSTAAADTPRWLKNVRELGDPVEAKSLVSEQAPRRSSSLSWISAMERSARKSLRQGPSASSSVGGSVVGGGLGRAHSIGAVSGRSIARSSEADSSRAPSPNSMGSTANRNSGSHLTSMERSGSAQSNSAESVRQRTMSAAARLSTSPSPTPSRSASLKVTSNYTRAPVVLAPRAPESLPLDLGNVPMFVPQANRPVSIISTMPLPLPAPHMFPSSATSSIRAASPPPIPPMNPRRRAASVMSAHSISGALSESGRSTATAPAHHHYRIPDAPLPVQVSVTPPNYTSSSMSALSVSAHSKVKPKAFSSRTVKDVTASAKSFNPRRDLTFGTLQRPPSKLSSSEILIEVIAVGIDLWDRERTCERAFMADGFGFVPGRSVCGRVVENGGNSTKFKRGEVVWGLSDLKKSGGLAQLMKIDRDCVSAAPTNGLMAEQIASLPLGGIPAVQVMESICQTLPRGSKILVLDAARGTGNLCMQLATHFRQTRDLWIVAQCQASDADSPGEFCRATGASDVIIDEPLAAINGLHESSFDVVIDTLGGRRLYDASRRILHFEGSFITTIGDELSISNTALQWKTGIRSLRRTFFKKDQKKISYWAVNLDRREHVRDTLDKLRVAVEQSGVTPPLRRILPFHEAGLAFEEDIGACTAVRVAV